MDIRIKFISNTDLKNNKIEYLRLKDGNKL